MEIGMCSKDLPHRKAPCRDCPFRKDTIKGWLGKARMEEILSQASFVCHKNTSLQCAGHMHIKEDRNDYVGLAARLQIDLGLVGRELVFDTEEDCVEHHSE